MLSGILRQELFTEKRKLPILGDIPILGGLFQSTDSKEANRELIIFITPNVIRDDSDVDEVMKEPREILDRLKLEMEKGRREADSKRDQMEPVP